MINGRIWIKGSKFKGNKITSSVVTMLKGGRMLLTGWAGGRMFIVAGTTDDIAARVTIR